MNIEAIVVKLVVAIVCAGIGNLLIPRRMPGGWIGYIVVGLAGVWLGDWAYAALNSEYGINFAFLNWAIAGVRIIPSVIGSVVVLTTIVALLRWGRYGQ